MLLPECTVTAAFASLFDFHLLMSDRCRIHSRGGKALADAVSRGGLQVHRQLHPSADWQPTPPQSIPTLPGEANHLPPCSTTVSMHYRVQLVSCTKPDNVTSNTLPPARSPARPSRRRLPRQVHCLPGTRGNDHPNIYQDIPVGCPVLAH